MLGVQFGVYIHGVFPSTLTWEGGAPGRGVVASSHQGLCSPGVQRRVVLAGHPLIHPTLSLTILNAWRSSDRPAPKTPPFAPPSIQQSSGLGGEPFGCGVLPGLWVWASSYPGMLAQLSYCEI